jgi:transposase
LLAESVPWDTMTQTTTILTDLYLARGGDTKRCMFVAKPKKGSKKAESLRKIRDSVWAKMHRPRLPKETREAVNKALWGLERASSDYARLSKRKEELARRCANYTVKTAEKRAQCGRTLIALEDLSIGFFHGRGRREPGWCGFFTGKKENRWLMQALHKAFSELAKHRGYHVIAIAPAYTSQTCPLCRHQDPNNRDQHNREAFHCTACGFRGNADLDVATHNIAMIAISGQSLKRAPQCRPNPRTRSRLRKSL